MGAIIALESLKKPCMVDLHSDSSYVIKAFNEGWLENWQRNGWKNSKKEPVKNKALWFRLLEAAKPHRINWIWVKGHAGDEYNERCDALATSAADAPEADLLSDDGEGDLRV